MAVNEDVMKIVRILDDEGFGVLAGELLTEISLGRESQEGASISTEVKTIDDDRRVRRVPIPEEDQLAEAIRILQLRLVEPARVLAEAEAIVGELTELSSVRIRFIAPEEGSDIEQLDDRNPGSRVAADALSGLLERIAGRRQV
jgi:hypothetical protein